jgi:hypothetical protein
MPLGVQRTNIELSFSGDLPHGWQLWSGYAWLDARMVSSIAMDAGQAVQGKRPTLTPEHSANLWLTKALGGGFGAGAGLNYVGDRFANPNTVTLPSYTTVDAMAYYRVKGLDLQLNLTNLFDRKYIVAGHGSKCQPEPAGRSARSAADRPLRLLRTARCLPATPPPSSTANLCRPTTRPPAAPQPARGAPRLAAQDPSLRGLWGAALGLLFGATGILLNHRAVLKIPVEKTVQTTVQLQLPRAFGTPTSLPAGCAMSWFPQPKSPR